MNIAIVDDKDADRARLCHLLKKFLTKKNLGNLKTDAFKSGEEFLECFDAAKYGAVFLDIHMKGLSGIETAYKIRQKSGDIDIVFVTADNGFASESYKLGASWYILKPYGEKELSAALEHIKLFKEKAHRMLILPDKQIIPVNLIVRTSFSGHYVSIYLKDGEVLHSRITQSEFLKLLLVYPEFVACNKGMTVNLKETLSFEKDRFLTSDNEYIPISRRRQSEVKKAYEMFINTIFQ